MAVIARAVFDAALGPVMPLAVFFTATGLVSRFAGTGPGVFTAALGWVAVEIWFQRGGIAAHPAASLAAYAALSGVIVLLTRRAWLAEARIREHERHAAAREDELARLEARYRALTGASVGLVASFDNDGCMREPQRAWELYTGQGWEEHGGRGWLAAVHPEDRRALMQRSDRVRAEGTVLRHEARLWNAASGGYRWVRVHALPLRDADGAVREWVAGVNDVHDRREAEAAARQTEALLRSVADASPACIYIKDREQRFIFRNAALMRLFPASDDDPSAVRTDREVLPSAIPGRTAENDAAVFARGVPMEFEEEVLQQGSIHTYISIKFPLHDEQGHAYAIGGVSTDITERKAAEIELRRLASLIDASRDLIGIADPDGRLQFLNAAGRRLVGIAPADDVRVLTITDIQFPDDARFAADVVIPTVIGAGHWSGELTLCHRITGEPILIWTDVVRIDDPATGRPINLGAVMRDIRERKAEEARRELDQARLADALATVEAANRAKDEFLATLSHELRNPLHAMMGWLRIARSQGVVPGGLLERALDTVERNLHRQARLVDDLLDVSRIIAGQIELALEPCDVARVVDGVLDSVRPIAARKGVTLIERLPDQPLRIVGDARRLGQAFGNLLANAVEYTSSGGHVEVLAAARDGFVEVTVRDDGEGIAAEFLPYVFERFRQADSSTTRSHGGLGLGLAIARHVVERHGGTLTAESAGRGRGAAFHVRLTAAPASVAEPRSPDADERLRGVATGLRVLLVDDDADTRDMMTMILGVAGADVQAAASTAEARDVLARGPVDVIVSDIGMAGDDGFALIRSVRAAEEGGGRRTPAIALTGFAAGTDRQRALESGFDAHVAKPIEPGRLVERVVEVAQQGTG